jgi:hypothetical protein
MKQNELLQFANELERSYETYRVASIVQRHISPEQFHQALDEIILEGKPLFTLREVGTSFEQRPIRLVSVGKGQTSVLLWSQMHGDESTATHALLDILSYLTHTRDNDVTRKILSSHTLHILPMLNPDGAARCQRRTAQGIDMNRDALSLQTPEARILKELQHTLKPAFGFNLHDQELSTVGSSRELSAIALLAPAYNREKSDNDVRLRAKHVASVFASVMNELIPGKVARYDDGFEPRAFGDNMQLWETSTLLVESGHALNDPDKRSIRKLNFIGIISCFAALATGLYRDSELSLYENLPFNGKRAYDLIIKNIQIDHGNGKVTTADIGISYQVDTHTESTPLLVDLGDLHTFIGLKEIDGKVRRIPHTELVLGKPFPWEQYITF